MSEEIKTLERERLEAMGRNDVAALDGLLADGLLYLHSTGDRDGKEALLGQIGDGTIVYRRVTPHEPEVHMLGDTAILFGHIDADVTRAGDGPDPRLRLSCSVGKGGRPLAVLRLPAAAVSGGLSRKICRPGAGGDPGAMRHPHQTWMGQTCISAPAQGPGRQRLAEDLAPFPRRRRIQSQTFQDVRLRGHDGGDCAAAPAFRQPKARSSAALKPPRALPACGASRSRRLTASFCSVRPMSSSPFSRQCLRKGSTSKADLLAVGPGDLLRFKVDGQACVGALAGRPPSTRRPPPGAGRWAGCRS